LEKKKKGEPTEAKIRIVTETTNIRDKGCLAKRGHSPNASVRKRKSRTGTAPKERSVTTRGGKESQNRKLSQELRSSTGEGGVEKETWGKSGRGKKKAGIRRRIWKKPGDEKISWMGWKVLPATAWKN